MCTHTQTGRQGVVHFRVHSPYFFWRWQKGTASVNRNRRRERKGSLQHAPLALGIIFASPHYILRPGRFSLPRARPCICPVPPHIHISSTVIQVRFTWRCILPTNLFFYSWLFVCLLESIPALPPSPPLNPNLLYVPISLYLPPPFFFFGGGGRYAVFPHPILPHHAFVILLPLCALALALCSCLCASTGTSFYCFLPLSVCICVCVIHLPSVLLHHYPPSGRITPTSRCRLAGGRWHCQVASRPLLSLSALSF